MALITCMSEPSTSSTTLTQKSNQTDEGQIQGPSGHHGGGQGGQEGSQEGGQLRCRHSRGVDDLQEEGEEEEEEEDSGCECSVEELERMDAWTKGGTQTKTNI